MAVESFILGECGANRLELGFLLVTRDGDMAALPSGDALLQGGVVQRATAPQRVRQRPLLGRRGTQFLFECLVYGLLVYWFHTPLFCLIGAEVAGTWLAAG